MGEDLTSAATPLLAERLIDGTCAERELDDLLAAIGVEHEKTGWDDYDSSLELYGVAPDARLTQPQQQAIFALGFAKIYVNHSDKWETHYAAPGDDGWRVSYPHKRGDEGGPILLDGIYPAKWHADWLRPGVDER